MNKYAEVQEVDTRTLEPSRQARRGSSEQCRRQRSVLCPTAGIYHSLRNP